MSVSTLKMGNSNTFLGRKVFYSNIYPHTLFSVNDHGIPETRDFLIIFSVFDSIFCVDICYVLSLLHMHFVSTFYAFLTF